MKSGDVKSNKIDGVVAMIMALGRSSLHDAGSQESVYENRGVLAF